MAAAALLLIVALTAPLVEGARAPRAAVVEIDGAIGPAAADYFARSLDDAEAAGATFVVLQLDTPGGLDESMRHIVKEVLGSSLPVVCYVAPSGARAASAGTFIVYACHIAAMAPGTTLGAATPVELGGPPTPLDERPERADGDEGEKAAEPRTAQERKVLEDAVAYIRSLAELRDRNADWAEDAVREGASLSASKALERDVIDVIAGDRTTLFDAIDGRTALVRGDAMTMESRGADVIELLPDWKTRFLTVITDPNVALLLLMLGLYGVIFELASPGLVIPGVLGVLCLAVGLYGLHVLPLNYAGVGLLVLGIALLGAEALAPSFGVLGIGGVIALVAGAVLLVDTDVPAFRVSRPVLAVIGGTSAAFFLLVLRLALRARRQKVVSGAEAFLGARAVTLDDWAGKSGSVRIAGERWRAESDVAVAPGAPVDVVGVDGLLLQVHPRETP